MLLLRDRAAFWAQVCAGGASGRLTAELLRFIVLASAAYGLVFGAWRSPRLAVYVGIKFPILLVGTTSIVMVLNWLVALMLGGRLAFRQVVAVTYAAMAAACWVLLGLVPVTLFFTFSAAAGGGTHAARQLTHNGLLLTQIALIGGAGVAGNAALRDGLARMLPGSCRVGPLFACWLASFAFVGCQLSWIMRPFVGSPFFPVVFMRPDCLERNFYEFVFLEVIPYVLKGG